MISNLSTFTHPNDEPEQQDRIDDVERIAVLRAGGLGDLVFALPALDALRSAYPRAHMTVMCTPIQRALLANRRGPWNDAVAVPAMRGIWEDPQGYASDEEIDAFFASISEPGFDLAIQLHGGGAHSNPFIQRLGARVTAGCHIPGIAQLDRTVLHQYFHSETMRWNEVVRLVGATPRSLVPELAVTEADRAAAAAALPAPTDGRPEVVIHPGAGSPRRRWPVDAFAALGDRLAAEGARVILVGAPEEQLLTAAVAKQMEAPAVDLGGRLHLPALVGMLERAAVHAGNDSGPTHLARALGTPTVTIFWGPNVVTAGPIAPVQKHRTHLSWQMACEDCGAHLMNDMCEHESSSVDSVPLDPVVASVLELIESGRRERQGPPSRELLTS